jgi:hypothetical protein
MLVLGWLGLASTAFRPVCIPFHIAAVQNRPSIVPPPFLGRFLPDDPRINPRSLEREFRRTESEVIVGGGFVDALIKGALGLVLLTVSRRPCRADPRASWNSRHAR